MSSPFSQTTRSLETDTVRGALCAWLPAVLMLAAWAAWFVSAHVTETVVSTQAQVDLAAPPHGLLIVAGFASEAALGRVQPGQRAWLRVDGAGADVDARVLRVDAQANGGQVRVELVPLPGAVARLRPGLVGVAEVAVGQATPARLLARALGWPASAGR